MAEWTGDKAWGKFGSFLVAIFPGFSGGKVRTVWEVACMDAQALSLIYTLTAVR